jgi:putative DNA primase/helicase
LNEELEQKLLEENPPYNLNELNEESIFDDNIFNWLITIKSVGEKQKQKRKLIKKATELGVKTDFCEFLKQCERKFAKEEKQQIKQNMLMKQSHNEIGDKLLQDNNMYIFENDICIYENGVYKKNEKDIERKVIELVPDSTIHFRNEVYQYLLLKAEEKEFDRENGIINFKNGLFSVKERKMYNHSPKYFSTNQINTNFNLTAPKVQAVDDVLDKLSCGKYERKQTILEMIGYSMTTSIKLQKAFILYGNKARNGKSTLIDIIVHLLGDDNVGTVSFKDMNQNRFAGSGIKNKLLNSGSEMTDEYIEDVEIFKKYVTGDYLEIEEKFKPRQKIRPYAKFIFSANELPRVADKTDGFYRRLQIIPLEYSFTDKDRKSFDFNKLISKEALEYLAKISLEAYLNMGENFSNHEENEIEIAKYKVGANSILTFINDEEYITSLIEKTSTSRFANEIYNLYKQYCADNQYRAIGRNKFYKEIEKSELISAIGKSNNQKTYIFNLDFYKKF